MNRTLYLALACLVMFLACYLPRVIPLVFIRKKIKSKFIKSILFYMPYAVIAALTFPSIFFALGSSNSAILIASIATVIAVGLSFFNVNMAIVALICTLTVFGLGYIPFGF